MSKPRRIFRFRASPLEWAVALRLVPAHILIDEPPPPPARRLPPEPIQTHPEPA